MNLEIHNKIEGLKFLGGSLNTQDLFTMELETLLAEAKAADDQELVKKLRTVGKHQIAYLLTEHINGQIKERLARQQAVAP